jgi:DNA-3-methyladenine glycosylase II
VITDRDTPARLDESLLQRGVRVLAHRDPDLHRAVERHGRPPLWPREPGFQTLVRIILEQQVTLSSGEAAYRRLESAAGAIEPEALVRLGEDGARAAGLTRQKSRYVIGLAQAVAGDGLDLQAVDRLTDEGVRTALLAIPGIGRWTTDVYLLMALRRPDAWPAADIALAASVQFVKQLAARPTPTELDVIAESWRPWRAVAARLLWHSYLSGDRPDRANGSRSSNAC